MAASIQLRLRQFDKFANLKGLRTLVARANAIGVNPSNLSRVLANKQAPGAQFIAGTLVAFPELEFDDLFEVVDSVEDVAA